MKREIDEKAEWLRSFRDRYRKAGKSGKNELLGVHGMHRKSAIRLMANKRVDRKPEGSQRGPKPKYQDKEFIEALRHVWLRQSL